MDKEESKYSVNYDDCHIFYNAPDRQSNWKGDTFESFDDAKNALIQYHHFIISQAKNNLKAAKKLKPKDLL